jgi:hypothetical protein
MAEAIIVDDGGSTRIKRVMNGSAVGAMDSLLDVDDLGNGTRGSNHTVSDAYTNLLIVIQDKFGKPFTISDSSFTTVEISSGLAQEITAQKNGGSSLTLTVFSGASDPIVESKQHRKKRRYVVSNSGPIEKIVVDGAIVFNVRQGESPVLPATATKPIVYTSVVLT